MARRPRLYQKLARARGVIAIRSSLWLAADHVLLVEESFIHERYQRVWLRDVQGFFLRSSRQATLVMTISAICTALFGGLSFLEGEAGIFFRVLLALSFLVLLYGVFFARNCHLYVLTAVQRGEWRPVALRRQARKVLARLDPLIREAQRELAVSSAPAGVAVGAATTSEPTPVASALSPQASGPAEASSASAAPASGPAA